LERRIAVSSNGYIFPVRRPKVKNKDVSHVSSLKGAREKVIKDCFPDDPFTAYTFRHTYATRHAQAGTELPVLAELMGHAKIQTTMIYVHASKKMKIEAAEKLQAYVETAREAKELQEEQEAESCKPMEDEWDVPIYENDASSPQNPPQDEEIENFPF
jgi:hypothetical protein